MDYMIELAAELRARADETATGVRARIDRLASELAADHAWLEASADARLELAADAMYQRSSLAVEAAHALGWYPPFIRDLLDRVLDIVGQNATGPFPAQARGSSLRLGFNQSVHSQLASPETVWAAVKAAVDQDAAAGTIIEEIRAVGLAHARGAQPPEDATRSVRDFLLEHPALVRELAELVQANVGFSLVFARELKEVARSRQERWRTDRGAIVGRLQRMAAETRADLAAIQRSRETEDAKVKAREERIEDRRRRLAQLNDALQDLARVPDTAAAADGPDKEFIKIARRVTRDFTDARWSDTGGKADDTSPSPPPSDERHLSVLDARTQQLFGLSLSGGGIRSATVCLGALQALASRNLLRYVDYLSTVSGGGYIGSWLCAWAKRDGGIGHVQSCLSRDQSPDPDAERVRPIRFLREYSNYLTPRLGLLGADTWTMISIWWRNTTLNQTVLGLMLLALLIVPRALVGIAYVHTVWLNPIAFLAFAAACGAIGWNLKLLVTGKGIPDQQQRRGYGHGRVQALVVAPIFLAAVLVSIVSASAALHDPADQQPLAPDMVLRAVGPLVTRTRDVVLAAGRLLPAATHGPLRTIAGPGLGNLARVVVPMLLLLVGLVVVQICGGFGYCFFVDETRDPVSGSMSTPEWYRVAGNDAAVFGANLVSAIAGALIVMLARLVFVHYAMPIPPGRETAWSWDAVAFGPPILVLAFCASGVMQMGLLGLDYPDARREWIARLGAWLLIYSGLWLAIFSVSIYGPLWVLSAPAWIAGAGGLGWIASTAAGLLAGQSARSGGLTPAWRDRIATAAMYVFVAGLLLAIATVMHVDLAKLHAPSAGWRATVTPMGYWNYEHAADSPWMAVVIGLAVLLAFALAWRVDVNEFSMHHFYKNRLVRCYLGASRIAERSPNPFTGFDMNDDLRLARLRLDDPVPQAHDRRSFIGPLPILNATLNMVKGASLAWQERKGASFAFTPFYSGYTPWPGNGARRDDPGKNGASSPAGSATDAPGREAPPADRGGYRPTLQYGYAKDWGVALGTATAISGAAASPNQGYQSSAAAAFLMTVFNARLGWWIGNTCRSWKWRRASPRNGLLYLLTELTGSASDTSAFVNLSDGGHFDNLGVYELVRRRCRYILAIDAEDDHAMAFNALGIAVRKCRIDFGAEIRIDVSEIRHNDAEKRSRRHWAVGTIRYVDGSQGTLVYVKSSLTKRQSIDIEQYASAHTRFPHETTADQFFTESQFESYRALGEQMVEDLCDESPATPYLVHWHDVTRMFDALERFAPGRP